MKDPQAHGPRPYGSLVEMLRAEKIRYVMSSDPLFVAPNTSVRGVVEAMRDGNISYALVREGDRLTGIFTERDFLDKIAGSAQRLAEPVRSHMSRDPRTLGPEDSVGDLLQIICEGGYRHLPVVEDGQCLGLVCALDVVRAIADLFPEDVYNLPPKLDQVMPDVEGA